MSEALKNVDSSEESSASREDRLRVHATHRRHVRYEPHDASLELPFVLVAELSTALRLASKESTDVDEIASDVPSQVPALYCDRLLDNVVKSRAELRETIDACGPPLLGLLDGFGERLRAVKV